MKSNLGVWLVRARSAGNLYPKPHINMHQNKNFTNLILLTSNTKYYILEGWQEIKAPAICFNINPQLFFSKRFLTPSLTDCRKTTRIEELKSKLGGRLTKIILAKLLEKVWTEIEKKMWVKGESKVGQDLSQLETIEWKKYFLKRFYFCSNPEFRENILLSLNPIEARETVVFLEFWCSELRNNLDLRSRCL